MDDRERGGMRCVGVSDLMTRKFYAALAAELLGTMILVIGACGSAIAPSRPCAYSPAQGYTLTPACSSTTAAISLGFTFSVATAVWVTAHVSGGHLNPAVSFGMLVARRISLLRFVLYVVCQSAGAIFGALILRYTAPSPIDDGALGTSGLAPGVSVGRGFGIETVITFILVFTVFSAVDANRTDKGGSIPLTIGLSIGMCHLWAVPFTGAGMNPARVLGPALVSGTWDDHWIYWVAAFLGGGLAAILYDFVFAVNATPLKIASCCRPDYDDADFDERGRKSDDVYTRRPHPLSHIPAHYPNNNNHVHDHPRPELLN